MLSPKYKKCCAHDLLKNHFPLSDLRCKRPKNFIIINHHAVTAFCFFSCSRAAGGVYCVCSYAQVALRSSDLLMESDESYIAQNRLNAPITACIVRVICKSKPPHFVIASCFLFFLRHTSRFGFHSTLLKGSFAIVHFLTFVANECFSFVFNDPPLLFDLHKEISLVRVNCLIIFSLVEHGFDYIFL